MTPFFYSSPPKSRFISWVVAAYLLLGTVGWFAWLMQLGLVYLLFMPVVMVVPWLVIRGYREGYDTAQLGIVVLGLWLAELLIIPGLRWMVLPGAACLVFFSYCLSQHRKIREAQQPLATTGTPPAPVPPIGSPLPGPRTFLLHGSLKAWLVTGVVAANLLVVYVWPVYRIVVVVGAPALGVMLCLLWLCVPALVIAGARLGYGFAKFVSAGLAICTPMAILNPFRWEDYDLGHRLNEFWPDTIAYGGYEILFLLSYYCLEQHQLMRALAAIRRPFNAPPAAAPDPASPPPA